MGLAGCSSDGDAAMPTATPAAETTTSSAEPAATTAQWASLVAEGKAGAVDAHQAWVDADCLPSDAAAGGVCSIMLLTLGSAADTLSISLDTGVNPESTGYIGEPPAEIADLVTATQEQADAASDAAEAAGAACPGAECEGPAFKVDLEYGKLMAKLDAWSPYGG